VLQQRQQRLENFPIPVNPLAAPSALSRGGEPEMTSVTLLKTPTRLWSQAGAMESITVSTAEQHEL